ncbi:M15 family metallopeptidase [Phycicoccus sonneratiae]|uniref:M15 family metallopeptidase n=1 Tax=Phycicoccus sonneratiae TaxID=2807628 RepID=A0ABS2CJ88_9MICO|nr:M15 family metallopeptidase [Phycicoccus sonneraticus]MBM6399942.1 M15 family metallopeptidase [Phycicoccus sonneraticus]
MRPRTPAVLLAAAALLGTLAVPGAAAAPASSGPAPAAGLERAVAAWHPGHRLPFLALVTPVDRRTRASMVGVSWKPGCPVPIEDLRIVTMTYWGFDDRPHLGRLMVHEDVARDVARVFGQLYDRRFPIRRMELIERYDADDDASMAADNTSAFNCRPITGTTDRFSIHSYGKAIDVNTIENPYVKGDLVLPAAGRAFLDRTDVRPGMVVAGDAVVKAFADKGFAWGGDYVTLKDYQHFEIPNP